MLTSTFDWEEHCQRQFAGEVVSAVSFADYRDGIDAAEIARNKTSFNGYL